MRRDDAFTRTYGVAPQWLSGLASTALVLVLALAVGLIRPDTRPAVRRLLTNETGPVELATFASFIVCALLASRLALEARGRDGARSVALVFALCAAAAGLAGMEEISWGQSLFDFPTPEWLNEINAQGETNLHNLDLVTDLSSASVLVMALAGLVATRFARRGRGACFVVPSALWPLFAMIAAMGTVETVNDLGWLDVTAAGIVGALSEAAELLLAIAFLVVAWLNRRRLHREWWGAADADPVADPIDHDRTAA